MTSQTASQTRTSTLLPSLLLPPQSSSCEGDNKTTHKYVANTSSCTMSYLLHPPPCWRPPSPPRRHPPPQPSPGMPLSDRAPPCGQASFRSPAPTKKKRKKKKKSFFLVGAGGPELAVTAQGAPQTRTSSLLPRFLLPRLLLPPQSSSCEGDKKQSNIVKQKAKDINNTRTTVILFFGKQSATVYLTRKTVGGGELNML